MNFKKVNNITGWVIFAISYATYLLTMEATASLWDCGEFLSCAFRLEVGHSPGAPLFMMLGRMFSLFAPTVLSRALWINSLSALMSGLCILFWTITHFAKKLIVKKGTEMTMANLIAIMGAGIVGALAYAYSDTFWFSAVEGEVYASSSFFTAIVFWAVLKWEEVADEPYADRWLLLIFCLVGLSTGVHLLNLLTIPAIVMVYYFRRYDVNWRGSLIAFFIGIAILGFVQFGIIQYVPITASWFDLHFVNDLGMPFSSGALFFMLLLAGIVTWLVIWAKKKNKYLLHIGALCFAFTVIGYSSYVAYIIRSKADVPIDMGNPDNVMSLVPFLARDQYGAQPIFFGPDFTSHVTDVEKGGDIYEPVVKDGKSSYELVDHKPVYVYDHTGFFPRTWESQEPGHAQYYQSYLGLEKDQDPSFVDKMKFFLGYQNNWMYWRYVMWNYAGRQNDMEGQGEAHNGNWLSGIKPIDKMFGKGDEDLLPNSYKHNKARNQLYFLPLILGFLGLVYQFNKEDKKDGIIVALLFFFTGTAIVLYLNNTPLQPRERDYAYAGSTYAYAIWIGLGVLMVVDWFKKVLTGNMPAIAATLICVLAAPVLMANVEWDDHDRSQKTIARDHAYDMLMSCDKNAILLTYGDNDTYPLWYLQEVEGVRNDVRIINYNLLGTDWQNDQLNFKVNDADAIPVLWKPEDYRGNKLSYIPYYENPQIPKDKYFSLDEVIKFFTSPANQLSAQNGDKTNYLPTKNLFVKLDKAALIKSGLVSAADSASIPDVMQWQYKGNNAQRNDLALMNIIAGQAKTGWTRPIYLSDGTPNIGLDAYFESEGVLRKLVPMNKPAAMRGLAPCTNFDKNINLFTKTFTMEKASGKNVYYDEKNRLLFLVYRQNAAELALNLIAANRKEDAVKVLDAYMKMVSETSMPWDVLPYDGSIMYIAEAYYQAGAISKAKVIATKMAKNVSDEVAFFHSIGDNPSGQDLSIVQQNLGVFQNLAQIATQNGDAADGQKWNQELQALAKGVPSPQQQGAQQ